LAVHALKATRVRRRRCWPVINAFKKAHHLTDVTVVADAGMISEDNQKAIYAAGLTFILGARIPFLPSVVGEWRDAHPGEEIPDGHGLHPAVAGQQFGEGPRDPRSGRLLPVPR